MTAQNAYLTSLLIIKRKLTGQLQFLTNSIAVYTMESALNLNLIAYKTLSLLHILKGNVNK